MRSTHPFPSRVGMFAVGVLAATAGLAGCAVDEADSGSDATVRVGLVNSETGAYVTQAASFLNGFEAGLDYATGGTGEVDGHPIELVKRNDNGDQATGLNAAKELLGDGVKVIVGPTNSAIGIAMAQLTVENGATFIGGPSGTTELQAMDANVFPSWPGTTGLNGGVIANLGSDPSGKKLVYIGQDYAYGQGAFAALQASANPLGVETASVLLPVDTRDFTAAVLKVKDLDPDIVYFGWEGPGGSQLYNALADQGIYDSSQVITTLVSRAAFAPFAESAGVNLPKIILTSSYFEGAAGGNEIEEAMIAYADEAGAVVEYANPVGFNAALMVVRAIEEAGPGLEQEAVADALSGWTFDGPLGEATIRAEDHLIMQPQYSFTLVEEGETWTPQLVETYPADTLTPPVAKEIE